MRHCLRGALLCALIAIVYACINPNAPDTAVPFARTALTDSAAARAEVCGRAHGYLAPDRSYASLKLYVVPGYDMLLRGKTIWAYGTLWGSVYVAGDHATNNSVWAHEFLHQLYSLPGGTKHPHPQIFTDCGLLVPTSE